jgi:predicted Zn-dependent peptidase
MNINMSTIPGGLRILTAPIPGFQSASVAVFVRAGSRSENETNGGIAHFHEHMAFKGTASRSALQIAREIEELGSHINAYTGQDMTAYYVNGLGRNVPQAIAILGDVLTDSVLDPKEIGVEKGVILQEIKRHFDDPTSVALDELGITAYPDQAIGRPILGTPDFIRSVERHHFTDFVGANYRAPNIVIVGTGAVQHDEFVARAADAFAALPTGAAPAWAPATYRGGLSRDTSRPFEQVTAMIGFQSVPVTDSRAIAHMVLAELLGGGMSSPLFQEIREKRGLAYATGAWSDHGSDNGMMIIHAGTTSEHVREVFDVAASELAQAARAIEPSDLLRAKNTLLVRYATRKEKPFALAGHLAVNLFEHGRLIAPEDTMAAVEAVTEDDIRAAADFVTGSLPTVVLVGPSPDDDYLVRIGAGLC